MIDLKARSMQDNLIVLGISEGGYEDIEQELQTFFKTSLNQTTILTMTVSTEWENGMNVMSVPEKSLKNSRFLKIEITPD